MNSQNHHEIIVAGIHLDLTPSLKTFVQEKAARLYRHEDRIVRLRFELEYDPTQTNRFTAKGHVEIQGPNLNATVTTEECHKSVALLIAKLDRMLERRAQLRKSKRKQPRAIEFADVALPKIT
ncbi:ribosome-associated translation inhibitor RaiA [Horticoccus luteus]|uniref:Ribosome-associated translation inhibitor RaiA n=1 Tax=Horticoccus luteus TaxID=2862869 RepID=A0A8F9TZH2_9BACT|nr:ribosome-associated translation inhibitor RaiA [Horticoccus luteus]QYM80357.1 ribosome-associated translation inhibitor RaiA [Horticoccus luteus]